MFGLFNRDPKPPVSEEERLYLEKCFLWFRQEFGPDLIKLGPIYTPTDEDFPIAFIGSEENAFELLDLIAERMDLVPDDIDIDFYAEGQVELVTGAGSYARVFLRPDEGEKLTAGHFKGKDEDGCYRIGLNTQNLSDIEGLIATISHELAHIKLLGEGRMKKNNESLTDLLTIIYGFGIFGANSAATFRTGKFSWSHGRAGYLTQMMWGYALALHSYMRQEESPAWTKHLTDNVRADFRRGIRFIKAHPERIFASQQ